MTRWMWILLLLATTLATHAFGKVVLAGLLVVLSLATFTLLFVAGWVARQYIIPQPR